MDEKSLLLKMQVLYEKRTNLDFNRYHKKLQRDIPKGIDIKGLINKTIRPTKRRWKKIIMNNSSSEFNKEIDYIRTQFEKVDTNEVDKKKLISYINADSVEEYIKKLILEIDAWIDDDRQYLCEFKYVNSLSTRSIRSAIKYDLIIMNEKHTNVEIPEILSNIPIDVTNRADYLNDIQKRNLINDPLTKLDKIISLEDDEKEQLIMELERTTYLEIKQGANPNKYVDMMAQIALIKSIKYLNAFDVKVVIYFYSFRNIIKDEAINKSLYEILTEMNLPTGGKYYDLLENSIAKLGSLKLSLEINGMRYHGSLLSDIGIYYDSKMKVKRAEVHLGALLKEVSTQKLLVLEYDKELFESLSNCSKQIAIWLQKRRYKLAIAGKQLEESIPLVAFSNSIYFGTRRKDRIRSSIKESLKDVLNDKKVIIEQKYDNKLDVAYIKYKELSVEEMNRLFINIADTNKLIAPTEVKEIK